MSVYIRELARELGRRGHSVDIYARAHDPTDDQIVELGENARLIHLEAGEVEDIHKLVVYSYLADFLCELDWFTKRNGLQYDLIHSHYWLSGWLGRCLQPFWDVPHVTMFHTLGAVKNAVGMGEDEPELRIRAEKTLARDCHRIIAATEKEKDDLIRYYDAPPETVKVIPCGVNLDLFHPVDKESARQRLGFDDDGIILFVGRIDPLKGIDRLLAAMTYLKRRQGLRLVIIGGDDDSEAEVERLRRLSEELRVQDSVTFAGPVGHEVLPSYYSAAHVCVIPSYHESFGLVALESLACGTPVVAAGVGGIESVVRQGETGYVVKDNAPVRLADRIAALLSRPDGSAQSANSVRASVLRFGWPNIAETIIEEYKLVLAGYAARVC
ncbi:MAG: glycosyltransferase [Dehalococcoidia bacterium]|nr:MAG: glycosyltransferase [Dehalococcoidia bacterium]